ncbi:MAG: hypothetical protein SFV17_11135 [Candidatus Obscuribacter sp.]|nr:hypothetical protein [Candidatus Obscuribacter sp.]
MNHIPNYPIESNRQFNQIQNQYRGNFDNGFQIVDNSRVIRPTENNFEKTGGHDNAVRNLTSNDHTNAHEAMNRAAKSGNGVAFIVGSESTRDTQKLLDQMTELKKQNPGMEFVYLDKDKINADPAAGKWREWIQNTTGGDNLAFTSLQSVKAGPDGKPTMDRVVSTHWGGDIKDSLLDQNQYAKRFTSEHKDRFKFAAENPEAREGKPEGNGAEAPAQREAGQTQPKEGSETAAQDVFGMSKEEREELHKPGNEEKLDRKNKELFNKAAEAARKAGLPLVVNFEGRGCAPCLAKKNEANPELEKALDGKAVMLNMDASEDATREFLAGHGTEVNSWPATGVFSVDKDNNLKLHGQLMDGYTNQAALEKMPPERAAQAMSLDRLKAGIAGNLPDAGQEMQRQKKAQTSEAESSQQAPGGRLENLSPDKVRNRIMNTMLASEGSKVRAMADLAGEIQLLAV